MAADALSDLLKAVRLTGAVYYDVAARDPWVAEQPPRIMVLPKILPGAAHLISYHVVIEGQCYAAAIGEEPILLKAGEVVVFTRGDAHVMSSEPGLRADPAAAPAAFEAASAACLPFVLNLGGKGPVTAKLACGFLACDAQPFNPLLENLPRVMKAADPRGPNGGWFDHFIRLALRESMDRRAGGEGVLAKLSELMFIEVVRRHLETLPSEQSGWHAGLRDRFVGKALSLMHASPARSWTIGALAKEAGLSRSVLAERFAEFVGMPPMQYLAKWRMQVASGLLSAGEANIATVAVETGYGSEAAFSRAFKKIVGISPAAWRRRVEKAA